jgi:hypothetical protein
MGRACDRKEVHAVFSLKHEGRRPLGRPQHSLEMSS